MPRTEWLKAWAERRRGLPLIYNGNEIADNAMNATLAKAHAVSARGAMLFIQSARTHEPEGPVPG